jgi:hypothetical protein
MVHEFPWGNCQDSHSWGQDLEQGTSEYETGQLLDSGVQFCSFYANNGSLTPHSHHLMSCLFHYIYLPYRKYASDQIFIYQIYFDLYITTSLYKESESE